MKYPRILFVVKFRTTYDGRCGYDGTPASFGGLYHSALFVVQMLRAAGVEAKLVQVCDNNQIDKEVFDYKPDVVVVEALWVVPEKFDVLTKLHPKVQWIVRIHSEIPFLAYEGVAIGWIKEYVKRQNVIVAANSLCANRDIACIVGADGVVYLPNFYPVQDRRHKQHENHVLDIGCFGAIRPLKNQLLQAMAAMQFASEHKPEMYLRFHINTRTEQGGENVLKNLKSLFLDSGAELIQHHWETRDEFLATVAKMDIAMQVSFSETFDITAADGVALGVPLVTSKEVVWASDYVKAEQTNMASIVAKLYRVTGTAQEFLIRSNIRRLRKFCNESRETWLEYISAF